MRSATHLLSLQFLPLQCWSCHLPPVPHGAMTTPELSSLGDARGVQWFVDTLYCTACAHNAYANALQRGTPPSPCLLKACSTHSGISKVVKGRVYCEPSSSAIWRNKEVGPIRSHMPSQFSYDYDFHVRLRRFCNVPYQSFHSLSDLPSFSERYFFADFCFAASTSGP